jgi:hypothetical protein
MRFILILLGIAVSSAIVTLLLHKIKVRWIKYIPALFSLLFAVLMIILAQSGTGEGMQDLAWVVVSILSFAGAIGGGITAITIDLLNRTRR